MTSRLNQRLNLGAVLILAVLCLPTCTKHDPATNVKSNTGLSSDGAKLVIKSVEFYGWSGEGEKRKYVKLSKWEEVIKGNVSNPASFDVVCQVEYKGDLAIQEADYFALTTLVFLVGPDNQPPGDDNGTPNHNWSRLVTVNDVKMQVVPYLKSNETRQITFKDFDLGDQIKRFNDEDDILGRGRLR